VCITALFASFSKRTIPAEFLDLEMTPLLERFWSYILAHPDDIGWAAFFGLFFALLLDLMSADGRVWTGIRHVKNKLSERSVARLRKRIEELKGLRHGIAEFLSSDKALYMATFRVVVAMLICVAVGAGLGEIADMLLPSPFGVFALFWYGLAVFIGARGTKIVELNTRQKVTAMLEKRDAEMADLQQKLEAMTK
jgi:hypothetical protein